MAAKTKSYESQKRMGQFFVNLVLVLIALIFFVPIFGIFVTSFRQSETIFNSGWWEFFPHRSWVEVMELKLPEDQQTSGVMTFTMDDGTEFTGDYQSLKNDITVEIGRAHV